MPSLSSSFVVSSSAEALGYCSADDEDEDDRTMILLPPRKKQKKKKLSQRRGRRRCRSTAARLYYYDYFYSTSLAVCCVVLLLLWSVRGEDHHGEDAITTNHNHNHNNNNNTNTVAVPLNKRQQLLQYTLWKHVLSQLQKHEQQEKEDNATTTTTTASLLPLMQRYFQAYSSTVFPHSQLARLDRSHIFHASLPPMPLSLQRTTKRRIQHLFTRSYDKYMEHAFPAAQLHPLSCQPGTFDLVDLPALTLIDTLDTLLIMNNATEFARACERLQVLHYQQQQGDASTSSLFAVDQNVSLFETTIRVLGGLLSSHQLALKVLPTRQAVRYEQVFDDDNAKEEKRILRQWDYATENDIENEEDECGSSSNDNMAVDRMLNNHNDVDGDQNNNNHHLLMPSDLSVCPIHSPQQYYEQGSATSNAWTTLGASTATTRRSPQSQSHINNNNNTTNTCSARVWVYNNCLLDMAVDLAERLLPAFDTKTGIPYGTVNLIHGVPQGETTIASLAGAGTLTLELETLSKLTGDPRFGKVAKRAMRALFLRRNSHTQLFGKHMDVHSGQWTETLSGIGSNSDSFFEYLMKHYVLFPHDTDFWSMFVTSYAGVHNHLRVAEWFGDVDMSMGNLLRAGGLNVRHVLESLMAFYPGLQVLVGELSPAAKSLNSMFLVREYLGFLPERFHFGQWKVEAGRGAAKHPLRPELLESCYFLHEATKDIVTSSSASSGWQWAAEFALRKLEEVTQVECGHASVQSIAPETTGPVNATARAEYLYDEMPSFFLSETLKYLYLLFDEDNVLHTDDDHSWVFTTEAHPLHHVPEPDWKEQQVFQLKQILQERIHPRRKLYPRQQQQKHRERRQHQHVQGEYWSERTTLSAFSKDLQAAEDAHELGGSDTHGNVFFDEQQLIGPYVPPEFVSSDLVNDTLKQNGNWAHLAMTNLGSQTQLRKSCPNVHTSDLLWMHALNGGALDYTDMYVSVGSDALTDHPIHFVVLGAAEALGVLGSGDMFANKLDGSLNLCATNQKQSKADVNMAVTTTSQADTLASVSNPMDAESMKSVRIKSPLGDFDVETYGGEGFYLHHIESGETIMTTFLPDVTDPGNDFVMVYSGSSGGQIEATDPTVSRPKKSSSFSVPFVSRNNNNQHDDTDNLHHERQDMTTMDERQVVMADFNSNTFTCQVEVVEKYSDDHAELSESEEILARYPCAPAMFGPTSFAELLRTDGVFVEQTAIAPAMHDETGCSRHTTDESHLKGDMVPSIRKDTSCNADTSSHSCSGPIRIVRRGDCSFYNKVAHQRLFYNSNGVIVINTDPGDLFTMSYTDAGEVFMAPDKIPCAVLVTGLDGDNLLSRLTVVQEDEYARIIVRVSVSRQGKKIAGGVQVDDDDDDGEMTWPIVQGQSNSLQIYAKSGWGVQAQRQANAGGSLMSKDWNLQLFRHNFSTLTSEHGDDEGEEESADATNIDLDNTE
jgi:mannosidase alpha-like ER degradation enhancer 2